MKPSKIRKQSILVRHITTVWKT